MSLSDLWPMMLEVVYKQKWGYATDVEDDV